MRLRSKRFALFAVAVSAAALPAGCDAPRGLYQWGSYETQVYNYFMGKSRTEQIEALESDLQRTQARSRPAPPGVRAHLGLLYLEAGNDGKALENFLAEKSQYPEAESFIDFLLKKDKTVAATKGQSS